MDDSKHADGLAQAQQIEAHLQAYREAMPEAHRAIFEKPKHADVHAERLYRKQRLAGVFRLFDRLGFGDGVAGHVTARDPERSDCFWVNPLAQSFSTICVSDLLLVDHRGVVVEGSRPVNPAAFAIHSAIHRARPDVVAVAHAHSDHGLAWSAKRRLLDPLTQDACAFFEDHSLFSAYDGPAVSEREGDEVAQTLADNKAVILANHGLITVGESVESCAWWFIALERACKVQLLAEAGGGCSPIPESTARATREIQGSEGIGWFNFLPVWEKLCHTDEDFLC